MSVVQEFRTIAESLAFNPTEYDQFNADIQAAIEHADPALALELATLKLEVNRRFYVGMGWDKRDAQ